MICLLPLGHPHLHTLLPEVNLAHLGRGVVCAQSIQSSFQYIVDILLKKKKKTDPFSEHDDNSCSDKLHLQTHTLNKQSPVGEYEEALRQLAQQPNGAINHLCRQRRENDRRTLSSQPRAAVLPSLYVHFYLSTSPSPSFHACPVSGKALFLSRQNQQPRGERIKRKREREMWEERKKENDGVKLLQDAHTHSGRGREKLPQITKDKKGAIRSFCLVTFIVSPVLMAKKLPPTSPLLSNPPTTPNSPVDLLSHTE